MNPCNPSPCGPNSQCKEVNRQAVCSCLPTYTGSPPDCRPECVVSSECPLDKACINQKCSNPCPGTCGLSTVCSVINHSPICSCSPGFTGDPFTRCYRLPRKFLLLFKMQLFYLSLLDSSRTYARHKRCNKPLCTVTLRTEFSM